MHFGGVRCILSIVAAIGTLCAVLADTTPDLNSQTQWQTPLLNENIADILAGPLEYSWSGSAPASTCPEFAASATPYRSHLKTLQATFEQNMGRFQAISIEDVFSLLNADQKPLDCKALQPKLYEQLSQVSNALSTIETDFPSLRGTIAPLRKLVIDPLTKQVDVGGLAYLRRTQMGLLGFMNICQFLTADTARVMGGITTSAGQLLTELQDVISCTNRSLLFGLAASHTGDMGPSCAALQEMYDEYLAQAKAMINDGKAKDIRKETLDAALASLQFQTAGAYLSDQSATDAIAAMGKSDLSATMKLVQGAGDALQACQQSIHARAVRQEALQDSVSSIEQTIYSHLALNIHRIDPVVRSRIENATTSSENSSQSENYLKCENDFSAAVTAGQEIVHSIGTLASQNTATKVTQTIMAGYVKRIERQLREPVSLDVMVELRQLEIAVALLVRNTKRSLGDNSDANELTDDLQQLESKIHKLSDCMFGLQDKSATSASQGSLKCDILAEVFKETLVHISRELEKTEKAGADMEAIGLFRSWIQLLRQSASEGVHTGTVTDFQVRSFTEILAQAKGMGEMVKLIPLVTAHANSLEACMNVQEATAGESQEGEENFEYDPDDTDIVEPGWDEDDSGEHWVNGQGGYSVYAGVPSVEQLASEFESGLHFKDREENDVSIADIPSDMSSDPKYDCMAIVSEASETMSQIGEQLNMVAKEVPQLAPMMEQVMISSHKIQDELALHPKYAKYYMRSMSVVFETVNWILDPIPRGLEAASEFFTDLADAAFVARHCLQIKPENPSEVVPATSEEKKEEERVEQAVCDPLGEILGATAQFAIRQWSEFAQTGSSDGRLQQTVQQGLGLLQKLNKAIIARGESSSSSTTSWSDKSITDAVVALVVPGSFERESHTEFRVLQDAFEQTMLQGRALMACVSVVEWE
ncbi:hypothetical protein MVEG_11918 [Podila verticillata NRRL 6337]|uniref:Uncharacterized protein n=1 Tax=Podila verticillata NRRL 6337 TaxID=1069443 RepID=A0A086TKP8_9FUNG|nr:hypothetical protein MVEG_11918 [Podila verticillata NRRL 6337]